MNRYLILLCICSLVMMVSVVAAEENATPTPDESSVLKGDGGTLEEQQQSQQTTSEKADVYKPKEKSVKYTDKTSIIDTIIWTFSDLLGLQQGTKTETKNEVTVEIDGKVIAIIPADSKLKDLVLHEDCLKEGYGTQRWYSCEEFFQ